MRYGFDNGNGTSVENGIRFLEYPLIKRGNEITENVSVPGRKGTLTIKTRGYEDTSIENTLQIDWDSDTWEKKFQSIRKWLLSSSKVTYSDNESIFYKVKKVNIEEPERIYGRWGDFEVTFLCEPGEYLINGIQKYSLPEILYNPYSICEPTYYISGEGGCTIVVNGKVMTIDVGQDIVINTELMIAYKNDGSNQNIKVTGDYEDMFLVSGENQISVSPGFIVEIVPNWRIL